MKLIVFEGPDGSGKSTQVKLLFNYLKRKKIPVELIAFPRYDQWYGRLVKRMLLGEFGNQLNPYLSSLPFALDRFMAKKKILAWLKSGKIVLVDRYVASSLAHQGARLTGQAQTQFINWLYRTEYEINSLPKEDAVVYLHLPVTVARKLMQDRRQDLAEKNLQHQQRAQLVYEKLAKKFKHWVKIDCVDKKGTLLSKEAIHQKILWHLKLDQPESRK